MNEEEHRRLLELLSGDQRFSFSKDLENLDQGFETFNLADVPITRRAQPTPSQSLADERRQMINSIGGVANPLTQQAVLAAIDSPGFVGSARELMAANVLGESLDPLNINVGESRFLPALQPNRVPVRPPVTVGGQAVQQPTNQAPVSTEPRIAPVTPTPVPSARNLNLTLPNTGGNLPTPTLRPAPLQPSQSGTSGAQGINTPQVAMLLASLGAAIGGDSTGGRIAQAAGGFAQQQVAAQLSEKVINGEPVTAQDLLGIDPRTALAIRSQQVQEKQREQQLGLSERSVVTGEKAEKRLADESEVRTKAIQQQIDQSAARYEREEGFDAAGFFNELAPQFGLDLGGINFERLNLTSDQAKGIFSNFLDVQQAGLDRETRLQAAGISAAGGGGGGGGTATERRFRDLMGNPNFLPYLQRKKAEAQKQLNNPEFSDDPTTAKRLQERLDDIDEMLLLAGENPLEGIEEDKVGGEKLSGQAKRRSVNEMRLKILANRLFGFPLE